MAEVALQKRRDLMDGYVLDTKGGAVGDAIRSADISNSRNREILQRKGMQILTRHNSAGRPAELQSEPPTQEACEAALAVIYERREAILVDLRAQLKEADQEVKEVTLNRNERGFWRTRAKSLEKKIEQIATEQVTPRDLYVAFVREDVSLRARDVPPEIRAAMTAMERERAINTQLSEEEAELAAEAL